MTQDLHAIPNLAQAENRRRALSSERPAPVQPVPARFPTTPEPELSDGTRDTHWEGNGKISAAYARFIVDEESAQIRVQIRDAETDTVIREIPPEEMTRIAAGIRAYLDVLQTRRYQPAPGSTARHD